jgi:AcrR family transcriptional regulator
MEKKGVGRPRDGNPEETRHEILRAAADAFAEAGFVGATTRLVATRAGVNVATLHYHFGSKVGLYRAVLASVDRGPLPVLPEGSGVETVTRLVEALFARGAERPTLARLSLLDALAGPPRSGAEEGTGDRVRWAAQALRPHLKASNGLPPPDAESVARSIVTIADAALVAVLPKGLEGPRGPGEGNEAESPPVPAGAVRSAVLAAALRLTGLG